MPAESARKQAGGLSLTLRNNMSPNADILFLSPNADIGIMSSNVDKVSPC